MKTQGEPEKQQETRAEGEKWIAGCVRQDEELAPAPLPGAQAPRSELTNWIFTLKLARRGSPHILQTHEVNGRAAPLQPSLGSLRLA